MKKIELDDLEFARDHNYYYGQYKLEPTFGGFNVYYKKELLSDQPIPTEEALALVVEHDENRESGNKVETQTKE